MIRGRRTWLGVLSLAAAGPVAAQHEGDLEVGVDAGGQLGAVFAQDAPSPLYPFEEFGLSGWMGDEPGFESLGKPEADLFPLEEGCEIWLEVRSLDAALRVFDRGLNEAGVGDRFLLGGSDLHTHAYWFIDADDPAYDPYQDAWTGAFSLVDTGTTGYTPSNEIAIQFTTACKPGQALTVVCRDGAKVVAKLKGGRADAELTARLDGDANTDAELHVNDRGRGKVKFKGVADGPHEIEVVECGTTGNTECP